VQAFVDDFGLDPNRIRYTRVVEDDHQRILIVYGSYNQAGQAQFAIASLPTAIRSIKPKPVATATFAHPLETLTGSNSLVADTRADAIASTSVDPVDAGDEPGQAKRVMTDPDKEMTDTLAPPEPAAVPTRAEPELAVTDIEQPPPETPVPATPPLPASDQTRSADPAPIVVQVIDRPGETRPEAIVTAQAPTPAVTTRAEPQPAKPIVSTPVVTSPPTSARPAFASIDPGNFTLQLSSQRTVASTQRFIHRHHLDRSQLYLVLIDEGAGPRWLVLYSRYPDLESADTARARIPATIRSPWARRIAPLQQKMIRVL